jgi:hypothetical protein
LTEGRQRLVGQGRVDTGNRLGLIVQAVLQHLKALWISPKIIPGHEQVRMEPARGSVGFMPDETAVAGQGFTIAQKHTTKLRAIWGTRPVSANSEA